MTTRISRERPQTGYGNRRDSSTSLSISPEKYPKRVEDLMEKKIASEYHFNKHSRLRRIQSDLVNSKDSKTSSSDKEPPLKNGLKQRRGVRQENDMNESCSDYDLAASLPVRMSNLDVKWPPSKSFSGHSSPVNRNGSTNNMDSSDDERPVNDVSPTLIRRHTSLGSSQLMVSNKIDANNAKLAMMKKKLSPLPNRQRFQSLPSTTDDLNSSSNKPALNLVK